MGVGRVSLRDWATPLPVARNSLPPPLTVKRNEPLLVCPSETEVIRQTTVWTPGSEGLRGTSNVVLSEAWVSPVSTRVPFSLNTFMVLKTGSTASVR